MKILALEFSSSQRSVAIVASTANPSDPFDIAEVVETSASATHPFAMIDEALRQARIEREQVEVVTVGLGPGSYNGIRSAIAIAQGWQLAARTKLLGISTVDCLLDQARDDGLIGKIHIVIDAQRTEFYLATFEIEAGTNKINPIHPLRIVDRKTVDTVAAAGEPIIGPGVTQWFPNGREIFPRAAVLGRLALSRKNFVPGEHLEPIYLRETGFVKAPPPRKLPPVH